MRIVVCHLCLLLVCCKDLTAQHPIDTLVSTERAFAGMSREQGTRNAFLAFVDSSCLGYDDRGETVHIYDTWTKRKEDSSLLTWSPGWAVISRSADLGITTGPWAYRSNRSVEVPDAQGHFTTIWKKNGSGVWKAVVDLGVTHAQPVTKTDPITLVVPGSGPVSGDNTASEEDPEAGFPGAFAKNPGTYLARVTTDQSWWNLEGRQPCKGRDAILQCAAALPPGLLFREAGRFRAAAGDLVAVHGTASDHNNNPHSYIRVWQKNSEGRWQLLLMVLH